MRKVIVVDDEPRILRMLTSFLQVEGYEALGAVSAEAALPLCAEQLPDLVMLDIHLPGMDGIEACRLLRAQPDTMLVPVIIFSGHVTRVEAAAAGELGARIVRKPFKLEELKKVVAHEIGKAGPPG